MANVTTKTAKDAPALVRAGERWRFAAYLWKVGGEKGKPDEWKGKCCWAPELPQSYADAWVRGLCERAGMMKENGNAD